MKFKSRTIGQAYIEIYYWNSIYRRGHDDLGDHYLDCGDLSNALKCYSRARDYCTSSKHVVNMCLNVIKVRLLGWYLSFPDSNIFKFVHRGYTKSYRHNSRTVESWIYMSRSGCRYTHTACVFYLCPCARILKYNIAPFYCRGSLSPTTLLNWGT